MRSAFLEAMAIFITTTFAIIAALAWNAAILAVFMVVFGTTTGIASLLSYAIIVTVIGVLATYWIGKAIQRAKGKEEAQEEERLRKAS
jgi:membrane protein YqaA with SNARE-associated domain